MPRLAFAGHQLRARWRKLCHRLLVLVQLEIEAALELAALARQLLRVERELLVARRTRRHTAEVRQPGGATELAAAYADAPDPRGLLPCPDLPHLHPDLEGPGERLDQLPEIDALLGRVVERALGAIPLILHVSEFHLELVVGDDAPGPGEGILFPVAHLLPGVDVLHLRLADDLLDFVGVLDALALHLCPDELAGQRNNTQVFTGVGIDDRHIPGLHPAALANAVISFPVALEPHFHDVERPLTLGDGHPLEPIEHGHHVTTAVAAIAIGSAPSRLAILTFPARGTSHIRKIARGSIRLPGAVEKFHHPHAQIEEDGPAVYVAGDVTRRLLQLGLHVHDIAVVDVG